MTANDVDLNLLRVLDALLEAGSVVGAADRLHLSPPAVSRSLARLRRALDDPLLVRSGRGLVPTPRAVELRTEVRHALASATAVLTPAPAGFDPTQLQRRFAITADDAIVAGIGMALVERLSTQAPGVGVDFLPDTNEAQLLRTGTVDLDIGAPHGFTDDIESEELMTVSYTAVMRRRHPLAETKLTMNRYARAHHVVVSSKGLARGPIDDALAEHGLRRDHITVVPSTLAAAHVVAGGDAVGLLPAVSVAALGARLGLVTRPLPISTPEVRVCQSWHPRFSADPGHRWLRSLVRDLASDSAVPGSPRPGS